MEMQMEMQCEILRKWNENEMQIEMSLQSNVKTHQLCQALIPTSRLINIVFTNHKVFFCLMIFILTGKISKMIRNNEQHGSQILLQPSKLLRCGFASAFGKVHNIVSSNEGYQLRCNCKSFIDRGQGRGFSCPWSRTLEFLPANLHTHFTKNPKSAFRFLDKMFPHPNHLFLVKVRCFSANSTIFSSTLSPFLFRTSFMYFRATFSESA